MLIEKGPMHKQKNRTFHITGSSKKLTRMRQQSISHNFEIGGKGGKVDAVIHRCVQERVL